MEMEKYTATVTVEGEAPDGTWMDGYQEGAGHMIHATFASMADMLSFQYQCGMVIAYISHSEAKSLVEIMERASIEGEPLPADWMDFFRQLEGLARIRQERLGRDVSKLSLGA